MPQSTLTGMKQNLFDWGVGTAKKVKTYTLRHNGGTFNYLGEAINPTYGFAVSLDDERGVEMPVEDFTLTALQVFALNHGPYMTKFNRQAAAEREGLKFIGTWINEGTVYIDVATVIVTKDVGRVMQLAREHNQKAVYDFGSKRDLFTDKWFTQVFGPEMARWQEQEDAIPQGD